MSNPDPKPRHEFPPVGPAVPDGFVDRGASVGRGRFNPENRQEQDMDVTIW